MHFVWWGMFEKPGTVVHRPSVNILLRNKTFF